MYDLQFIKHNHWGWKMCSRISEGKIESLNFCPSTKNLSSENALGFRNLPKGIQMKMKQLRKSKSYWKTD